MTSNSRLVFSARSIDLAVQNSDSATRLSISRSHSTQVSLLPPPCEELTTSDPGSIAARVSPPGTTVVIRPERTNGRRSMCAGRSSSTKIGRRLSAIVGWAMNSRGSP